MPEVKTNTYYVSVLVHNRSDHCDPDARLSWLVPLLEAKLPLTLFIDAHYKSLLTQHARWNDLNHEKLSLQDWTLQQSATWKLYRGNVKLPAHRNEGKDTVYFMLLMNAKSELLKLAAKSCEYPFIAFVDAGIRKIFKQPAECFERFQSLRVKEDVSGVLIPGCWPPREYRFEDLVSRINWTYCGGFFVMPTSLADTFFEVNHKALQESIQKGFLTWEVNLWVSMRDIPFLWFASDHDDRMTQIPNCYLEEPSCPPDCPPDCPLPTCVP
jgi:hypothetical protein